MKLLGKCLRVNKFVLLQHVCLASLVTCPEGVQFYCPSHTYPAILFCTIFPFSEYCDAGEQPLDIFHLLR